MFPSVLNTFNRPSPTDRLNSPSHSALHNTVSSAVGQIEAVIGLSTSSAVGTLFYDVRSPLSDGGGHIQTANKGGTGQTTFNKGDLLVATSSSVLSKLAVSSDGLALVSNSSTATGMGWSTFPGKVFASTMSTSVTGVGATTVLNVTIPGSVLGTNNAMRTTAYWLCERSGGGSVLTKITYGGGIVGSVMFDATGNGSTSLVGVLTHTMFGNGATNSQRGVLNLNLTPVRKIYDGAANSGASLVAQFDVNSSSIESSAPQTMTMSVAQTTFCVNVINGILIEKIS